MKTDADLRDAIRTEIGYESALQCADIEVDVNDGYVTLMGRVDDPEQRAAAERAAYRVSGVRSVNSEITIVIGAPGIISRE